MADASRVCSQQALHCLGQGVRERALKKGNAPPIERPCMSLRQDGCVRGTEDDQGRWVAVSKGVSVRGG